MNASYLQTLADEANDERLRKRALPLQLLMTKAEYEARAGDYYTLVSENDPETKAVLNVLSEEDKQKCIERGFWFAYRSDGYYSYYYYMRWDKKPWWRFWE